MDRIEYKIDIHQSKKNEFLSFLTKHDAKVLFEKRLITSIYFDNEKFEMYQDSVEGLSPRKKIRLRFYGKKNFFLNDKNILLEKKFTNNSGRSKKSNKIDNADYILKNGILDSKYGLCRPKTKVFYLRSYYSLNDFRITLDENICFCLFDSKNNYQIEHSINEIIAEIKINNYSKIDELKKKFPFSEIRFSKYCKSVEILFQI